MEACRQQNCPLKCLTLVYGVHFKKYQFYKFFLNCRYHHFVATSIQVHTYAKRPEFKII